jgi:hypothetical protein
MSAAHSGEFTHPVESRCGAVAVVKVVGHHHQRGTGRSPRHCSVSTSRSSVGSRTGAPTRGAGGMFQCFSTGRSGCHRHVSSSRHVERSVRISRTTLSYVLRVKGYGTYQAGTAFGEEPRRTR